MPPTHSVKKLSIFNQYCLSCFFEDFSQQVWAKQAAELSISHIHFNERDVLDTLRQYALHPHKLLALNPKSEVVTVVNGVRSLHPLPNFLVLDTDRTIEEYTARVGQYAEGQEWAIMYYGYTLPPLYCRTRQNSLQIN